MTIHRCTVTVCRSLLDDGYHYFNNPAAVVGYSAGDGVYGQNLTYYNLPTFSQASALLLIDLVDGNTGTSLQPNLVTSVLRHLPSPRLSPFQSHLLSPSHPITLR